MLTLAPQIPTTPVAKRNYRTAGRLPYRTDAYAKVYELSQTQPISKACRSFGVSRSGYYNWLNR